MGITKKTKRSLSSYLGWHTRRGYFSEDAIEFIAKNDGRKSYVAAIVPNWEQEARIEYAKEVKKEPEVIKEPILITSKYYGSWDSDEIGEPYPMQLDITMVRDYEITKFQFEDFIKWTVAKQTKRTQSGKVWHVLRWLLKKPYWQHGIEHNGKVVEAVALLKKDGKKVKHWKFMEDDLKEFFPEKDSSRIISYLGVGADDGKN